jgi:hypothetical protein
VDNIVFLFSPDVAICFAFRCLRGKDILISEGNRNTREDP